MRDISNCFENNSFETKSEFAADGKIITKMAKTMT